MGYIIDQFEKVIKQNFWKYFKYAVNGSHLGLFLAGVIYSSYKISNYTIQGYTWLMVCLVISFVIEIIRVIVTFIIDSSRLKQKRVQDKKMAGEIRVPLLLMIFPFAIFIVSHIYICIKDDISEFKPPMIMLMFWYYELILVTIVSLLVIGAMYSREN